MFVSFGRVQDHLLRREGEGVESFGFRSRRVGWCFCRHGFLFQDLHEASDRVVLAPIGFVMGAALG